MGGMRRESQSRVRDARIVPPLVACFEIQSAYFGQYPAQGVLACFRGLFGSSAAELWIFLTNEQNRTAVELLRFHPQEITAAPSASSVTESPVLPPIRGAIL